jgi:nucleoside-diphosphate-sugar epimerase
MHSKMAEPTRVLVVGGTQFMGRATVALLLDSGFTVTILNRGRTANPFAEVRHVCCDRFDASAVRFFLRSEERVDCVVDFIAFEPHASVQLLIAHARRYVVISSDSVYEACDPALFVRSATGRLLEQSAARRHAARAKADEYGDGKLMIEAGLGLQPCLGGAPADSGGGGAVSACDCVALRLPDVFGCHENTGRQLKFFQRLLRGKAVGTRVDTEAAAEDQPNISLVFAADVATAVLAAVRAPADAVRGRALNVCCDDAPAWSALVEMFAASLALHSIA